MMRRIDQEAGRARIGERGEVLAPPRGQRIARGFIAEVRVGDIQRVRGAARIDQRVVVRVLDVPVRMLGAQRVLTRDPIRHDFEQQAQPVAVCELGEPRGFERARAGRERLGRPPEIGHVARKAGDARGPERADEHMIEAHAGDMRERLRPCVERSDEAGVAEVEVRRKGRRGVHGAGVRAAVNDAGSPQHACLPGGVPWGKGGSETRGGGLSFYMTAGYCMHLHARHRADIRAVARGAIVIGFGKRHAGVAAHHRTVFDPVRERRR